MIKVLPIGFCLYTNHIVITYLHRILLFSASAIILVFALILANQLRNTLFCIRMSAKSVIRSGLAILPTWLLEHSNSAYPLLSSMAEGGSCPSDFFCPSIVDFLAENNGKYSGSADIDKVFSKRQLPHPLLRPPPAPPFTYPVSTTLASCSAWRIRTATRIPTRVPTTGHGRSKHGKNSVIINNIITATC